MLLESELPADKLARAVNKGMWTPPPPYEKVKDIPLMALCLKGQVVVYPASARPAPAAEGAGADALPHLTQRQQQVLQALAEGLTFKEIALRLGITTRTVSRHLSTIKQCLQASTTAQVINRAAILGLLHQEAHD